MEFDIFFMYVKYVLYGIGSFEFDVIKKIDVDVLSIEEFLVFGMEVFFIKGKY